MVLKLIKLCFRLGSDDLSSFRVFCSTILYMNFLNKLTNSTWIWRLNSVWTRNIVALKILKWKLFPNCFCLRLVEQQDCNGVNIDFQCHTFRFDIQSWPSAEDSCARSLSVPGLMGAHLTSIRSSEKQRQIEDFMDRFGMEGAWIGATDRPLLWQWLSSKSG